ncbi:MATE family efflux transporter [Vibrio sp. JC009]|uniref:MATE family efflux transporter n=1 Tax=Vibrio sp. JC009 TaxID=2912314 RepID=UPI0023AF9FB1|nr:MATE family efflux transporter [Vibrio sp. JC009]WED22986.1 MATE family efflux transporter [Vibrio sp. JC009]
MKTTLSHVYQHTKGDFLRRLIAIAMPIALQNLMFSSRGLVDVLMLAQLGEADVAAVGVASRAMFVTTIMLVGVNMGGALLTAQYWGAGDKKGVRESTALTWVIANSFALLTVVMFMFCSKQIMGLATDSQEVITLGSEYIVITSLSMFAVACVSSMAVGLRAMHRPGISTFFSGIGILSNVFLNWVLIFGNLGMPAMGIKGAAIATVLSGAIEVVCIYSYLYAKKHLLAFGLKELAIVMDSEKVRRFLKLSLPTTFNFFAWAAGIFSYHALMGQTGVQGLAALSVMTPVDQISFSLLIGTSNAAAVLTGNSIGAKKYDAVYYQAIGLLLLSILTGIFVATLLYFVQTPILNAFTALTPETRALADKFILILCLGIVIRSVPITLVVGVLRAGGDVKYCLYQDLATQWLIGIPLTAVAAIFLGVQPQWVYALFLLEEAIKCFTCVLRLKSKRWIVNLIEK